MINNIKPLKDFLDTLKDMDGFPLGRDEDIIAISDPPHYTACPNPYINDFIKENGKPYNEETDAYHREPFVGDISEGKNDPIYNAHSYHTKVPHKAIMQYIKHYTEPGDIVFDGFCGTGMTGVAAQMLGRKAILSDLSPIATFIAYNYNTKTDVKAFESEALRILDEVQKECGWMYETFHIDLITNRKIKATINYTVWSHVFVCPYCGSEIVFWDVAVDKKNGAVLDRFSCLSCKAAMKKTDCKRAVKIFFDKAIGKEIIQAKQVPVLINYSYKKEDKTKRGEKIPDEFDLELIKKIEESDIPYWYPIDRMPEGDESRRNDKTGITHVHHFYTKRNLWVLSTLKKLMQKNLRILFTSLLINNSRMGRYGKRTGNVSGTLYVPSLIKDLNVIYYTKRKIDGPKGFIGSIKNLSKITNAFRLSSQSIVAISNIPENSIDYIFTDPPFGDNLMYSELNFIWEAWLKVKTNNLTEAIINTTQQKGLSEYHNLMYKSFKECYRILKPNRWITVEFHNSKSSVWNAIQEGLTKAGFIIANVSILDKQQGSFKQVTSLGAVKNDLVISAYKPKISFQKRFLQNAGDGMEEEFIKMHLSHLSCEPSVERTEQMLYSKLLAFYVQRGYKVKYNASTFYKMLREKFIEEDGFWFLSYQIEYYREYKQKIKLENIEDIATGQKILFISDEKSAIIWLNTFLSTPKDFQEIHPAFTKISVISEDKMPDLRDILNDNFVCENEQYRRPMSEGEKLSINEKRERLLLREFEELLLEAKSSRKSIKECRKQALLYGFEYCYKKERFNDILVIAKKLDKSILENDSELNDFVEIAQINFSGM